MVNLTGVLFKYMPRWLPAIETHTSDKGFKRKHNLFKMTKFLGKRNRNCQNLAMRAFVRNIRIGQDARRSKRDDRVMRDLFSQRIVAACTEHRYPYKFFWGVLPTLSIELDRKVLSYLAIWEPRTFAALIKVCHAKVAEDPIGEQAEQLGPVEGVITRKLL